MLTKIFKIINLSKQNNYYFLFILILLSAALDVVGVASIFPFVSVLVNPSIINENNYFQLLFTKTSNLGITEIDEFIFFIGLMTLFIFTISIILRILTNYKQLQFTYRLEEDVSKFFLKNYLSLPYSWFLNKNSTELGKNILSEVSHVVSGTLMPVLVLLSQLIVIVFLLSLLSFASPKATFFAITVFICGYCFIYFTLKNFLKKIGKNRFDSNQQRYLIADEAFTAIKDIKFNKTEKFFINRFNTQIKIFTRSQFFFEGTANLPRFVVEALAFGGMIIVILYMISQNIAVLNILPHISMYVFAGYRLLPAMQQVFSSLSQLRFIRKSLDELYKDLIFFDTKISATNKSVQTKGVNELKITKNIQLKKINFNYPNSNKLIIKDLSMNIPLLKKTAIVGPTGAGKTTVIDIILGLLEPSDGKIMIDEKEVLIKNIEKWNDVIGYVPQQIYLSDNSIAYNIAFGKDDKDIDWNLLKKVSKVASIHDFIINNYNHGYNTLIGDNGARLSGGQKQRIGIARALYKKPKILIIDEGTNALDSLTEKTILESIGKLEEQVTLITITHRLNAIKNFDKICLISNGKLIAEGNYQELKNKSDIFEKMILAN